MTGISLKLIFADVTGRNSKKNTEQHPDSNENMGSEALESEEFKVDIDKE